MNKTIKHTIATKHYVLILLSLLMILGIIASVPITASASNSIGITAERITNFEANANINNSTYKENVLEIPIWRVLWLVYENIDVTVVADGRLQRFTPTLSDRMRDQIVGYAQFFKDFVEQAANGQVNIEVDVVISPRTVTSVSMVWGTSYSYWISPNDIRQDLNLYAPIGKYDSIIVSAEMGSIPRGGYWGLAFSTRPLASANFAGYGFVAVLDWVEHNRYVFIHEWMHQLEGFFRTFGFPCFPGADNAEKYGYHLKPERSFDADILAGKVWNAELQRYVGMTSEMWHLSPSSVVIPRLITQPVNQIVTAGQNAVFTVEAIGNPNPRFQWEVSTDGGNTWTNIAGAMNATFTLANTTIEHNGNLYRCVVTNLNGSVYSNHVVLTVNAAFVPVTAINKTSSLTVIAGTPLSLAAMVVPADSTNQAIVWSVRDAGGTGATISGNNLYTTIAGTVNVRATVADGTAVGTPFTRDFTVTVEPAPPTIIEVAIATYASPSNGGTATGGGTFNQGSSVTLSATANSGWNFIGWYESNNRVSTAATWTFTANANRTLQARFVQQPPPPPVISEISLSPSENNTRSYFADATVGYGALVPLITTVRNIGNQATGNLTVSLSGANANNFMLNTSSLASITAGGTSTFTVVPHTGLAAGTYTAIVTVSGANVQSQSFTVSFTVDQANQAPSPPPATPPPITPSPPTATPPPHPGQAPSRPAQAPVRPANPSQTHIINGTGTFICNSCGATKQGEFRNGQFNGHGTIWWIDGSAYQGTWVDNQMHGQGTVWFANGSVYEGDWVNSQMQGQGTFWWADGAVHQGAWANSRQHGWGTFWWANGQNRNGRWENGTFVN